jgi:hypothetical protein
MISFLRILFGEAFIGGIIVTNHALLRPEYGQTNSTQALMTILGNNTQDIQLLEQLYAIGSTANGFVITDDYDQVSAIYTDLVFQCPASIVANDSVHAGIPTWRYLFNATFPNTQPVPGIGVYHSSESMWIGKFSFYYPSVAHEYLLGPLHFIIIFYPSPFMRSLFLALFPD